MAMQTTPSGKLDRTTTCPFHLKLFYRTGTFHSLNDFPTHPSTPLPPHLQIYTWPTLTLRELSHLLVSALPSLIPNPAIGTRLAYRLIYPDTASAPASSASSGRFLAKDLGSVVVVPEDDSASSGGTLPDEEERKYVTSGVMAGPLAGEPDKTLQEARFVIGDFIDCCVLPPGKDGSVVGPPPVRGRGAVAVDMTARGPRENGYVGGSGGFRGRGKGGFGAPEGRLGGSGGGGLPSGEWRRGERLPEGGRGGFRGGRGRGW